MARRTSASSSTVSNTGFAMVRFQPRAEGRGLGKRGLRQLDAEDRIWSQQVRRLACKRNSGRSTKKLLSSLSRTGPRSFCRHSRDHGERNNATDRSHNETQALNFGATHSMRHTYYRSWLDAGVLLLLCSKREFQFCPVRTHLLHL
jgi:hypothetical protein